MDALDARWPVLACGVAFIAVQGAMAIFNSLTLASAMATDPGSGYASAAADPSARVPVALTIAAITFVAAVAPSIVAARDGGLPWVATLALLAYVLLNGSGITPIGVEWRTACDPCPWFVARWLGAIVDITLLSAPAYFASGGARSSMSRRDSVAATLLLASLLILAVWAFHLFGNPADLGAFVCAGAFALWLGAPRRQVFILGAVLLAWLSGGVRELGASLLPNPQYGVVSGLQAVLVTSVPILLAFVIGTLRHPIAGGFRRLSSSPLALFLALNLLNAVDGIASLTSVGSHRAVEANPVIELIGIPGKILFVLGASWFIAAKRPTWLIPAVAVFSVVAVYHLIGSLL